MCSLFFEGRVALLSGVARVLCGPWGQQIRLPWSGGAVRVLGSALADNIPGILTSSIPLGSLYNYTIVTPPTPYSNYQKAPILFFSELWLLLPPKPFPAFNVRLMYL